ncbi:hypothetical protein AB1285_23250 [Microbacterium sp. NRRL B-14842]|uniref:hypothetical protein n=1 Tax=Microbacterium sp. NRRL B-14842 TaxID=3162881 RepID=UPI003D26D540
MFVSKSYTGPQFLEAVIDQFDQLYSDSEHSGRVMSLTVAPVHRRPAVPPPLP